MKYARSLLLATMFVLAPAWGEEDCRLQIATSLPLDFESAGRPVVPAAINGNPIRLLVDTGAPSMGLQESKGKALGLDYQIAKRWEQAQIYGGTGLNRYATVKDFTLGKLKASGISFLLIPDEHEIEGADGLLGATILDYYDVDFDFAQAKMNLFLPHRCAGRVVYWTQDESAIATIPLDKEGGGHIRAEVEIEGQKIRATVDTGASMSVMDSETFMPKFGLTPQSPGMVEYHVSNDPYPRYRYVFKELHLQGVTVKNAHITFISQKFSQDRAYGMLLGMDILRELHLFIAYKERMYYITAATQH
jgi:predicted aspartyl protease